MLRWLSDRPTGQLLTRLAGEDRPISHQLLDELPARAEVHHLRHILVHAGVLTERTEYLDRIGPWLNQQLSQCPPSHAQIVQPFARWFLLHRARRNARVRGYTPQAGYKLRSHILAILEFLAWLDARGVDLTTAGQTDIDAWLATGPNSRRYRVRGFLTWARQRGIAGELAIPGRVAQSGPLRPLPDDEVWTQLRRCLHDTAIPLDVRVAGALTLLFGTTLTRLVRLHIHAVTIGERQVHLRLGRAPLLLPPVDQLVTDLARAPVDSSGFSGCFGHGRLLFPGRAPGHPIRAPALQNRLIRHGITPTPGRHAAILALASDLPAPRRRRPARRLIQDRDPLGRPHRRGLERLHRRPRRADRAIASPTTHPASNAACNTRTTVTTTTVARHSHRAASHKDPPAASTRHHTV